MNFSAYLRPGWAWLLPLLLLAACQITVFSPTKPVDDPSFGPNGQPRILSVTLPGMPPGNVRIDQDIKQIIITVPTSYSVQDIAPLFQLTPNTTFAETGNNRLWLFASNNSDVTRLRIQRVSGDGKNEYQVIYVPAGPLQFGQFAAPVSLTVNASDTQYCLPIYNFVDGQRDGTLTLTHRQTGQQLSFQQQGLSFWSPCSRINSTDGSVLVSFRMNGQRPYTPGDYTATFSKANGRVATLNQPITVVRGEPELFVANDNFVGTVTTLVGTGANLFATDQVKLLVYRKGGSVQTVPISFNANQIRAETQTSDSGYYYTQLVVNGAKSANVLRFTVRANERQVAVNNIIAWGTSDNMLRITGPTVSLDAPLVLLRDKYYSIGAGPQGGFREYESWRVRYRFTSTTNPTDEFMVESMAQNYSINIPATAKPGLYRLTAEGIITNAPTFGQPLQGSLPLDRVIQIQ